MMALFVRFVYVCAVDTIEGGGVILAGLSQ